MVINSLSIPNVDLDFMNQDHQAFIDLYDTLQALLDVPSVSSEEVGTQLGALLYHCREHFSREELQMENNAFPAYGCHKSEHARVLQQMEQELESWDSSANLQQLKAYLTQLPDWLSNHVSTMDMVTASFIARSSANN